MVGPNASAPGMFAQLATAYSAKHNIPMERIKETITHISWKSHQNGAKNPRAHLRKAATKEQIAGSPMVAYPLGLFDCCGVSDGSAAAIVCTPEIAKKLKPNDPMVRVKALQIAVSSGEEAAYDKWDGASVMTTRAASKRAYDEAGIKDPRAEISMMEVHDCFSITEMCTMEDLWISPRRGPRGHPRRLLRLDGQIPCQPDGGLKCFGHPIGASGIRMIFEMYNQLLDAGRKTGGEEPQVRAHPQPGRGANNNVCSIAIFGVD